MSRLGVQVLTEADMVDGQISELKISCCLQGGTMD